MGCGVRESSVTSPFPCSTRIATAGFAGVARRGNSHRRPGPVITHPHFTGTGTRTIRDNAKQAIDALFDRSFGKGRAPERSDRLMGADHFLIDCPYCAEQVEIYVEPDLRGSLVQDCEVCCNPWTVP